MTDQLQPTWRDDTTYKFGKTLFNHGCEMNFNVKGMRSNYLVIAIGEVRGGWLD